MSVWKLVTAGQDGCVKLWAVPLPKPSQKTLRRPRWLCTMKHEAAVNCARWSPTGRMIASCDAEAGKQPTSLAVIFSTIIFIIQMYPASSSSGIERNTVIIYKINIRLIRLSNSLVVMKACVGVYDCV